MAHIEFAEGLPGIRGPLVYSPETAKPMCDLVQVLLCDDHTLTRAEREMIGTYVSSQNDCHYCQHCHGSTAAQHLGGRFFTNLMRQSQSGFHYTHMKPIVYFHPMLMRPLPMA